MIHRSIMKSFETACILRVSVNHNGFQGGDRGHGGFVEINFISENSAWSLIIKDGDSYYTLEDPLLTDFTLRVEGDHERINLISALEYIVSELKENG